MKFAVDQNKCIGCGACEGICPKVFEMPDDKAQVILDPVPETLRKCALDAEDGCPVGAITHSNKE
ncbi:ferredoxin [Pontiella sp.]|uniref:ferredoxin n=1 Tax=Pontiella sp. TaxID=2837462 RepID=UPI0035644149